MGEEKQSGLKEALEYTCKLAVGLTDAKMARRGKDGEAPVVVLPEGLHVQGLQQFLPKAPDRIRARVQMVDVRSFVAYVNEHKAPESRVFASVLREPFGLTCALDYHRSVEFDDKPVGRAEFVTHICELQFTPTDAWREWKGKNGLAMPQDAFALFVEERQPDVVEPKGADMLEIARSIEATRDVSFKRRIRLDNGDTAFTFDDRTEATAGMNGALRIPEKIVLKFPLFLGMPDQCIECRFRHRLDSGRLMLSYEIVRPQELLLKTIQAALDIVKDETGLPAFLGTFENKA
jgi:uncharacterized protein YfdQ (DUF2303 family)